MDISDRYKCSTNVLNTKISEVENNISNTGSLVTATEYKDWIQRFEYKD